MKWLLILLTFPLISASECGKKDKSTGKDPIPGCIQKIIDDAGKDTPSNTPEQVDEYVYNGKTTYLVTAHCCDQYNVLYDMDCKPICAPTGGFTGKGDGKCPDFSANAKHVKLVWKNDKK